MICPKCSSTNGEHDSMWEEYWDGEDETTWLVSWWSCFDCKTATYSYENGYEESEE